VGIEAIAIDFSSIIEDANPVSTMNKVYKISISSLLFTAICWLVASKAEAGLACNEITKAMNFSVRAVKIEGRSVPKSLQEKVEKIVGVGQIYSRAAANDARNIIQAQLKQQSATELANSKYVVSYITSDTCDVSTAAHPKQVDVVFYPYYVRVDLINLGDNVLPIPRVNTPNFSVGVSPSLLAASPAISVLNDRSDGLSLNLKTKTNLLALFGNPQTDRPQQQDALNLNLDARRSLSQPFSNINLGLDYTRPDLTGKINPNLAIAYSNQFIPLGEGANWREQVQLEGGIHQKLDRSWFKTYTAGGGVRFSENRYTPRTGNVAKNAETGLNLYAIGDSRIGDGFARFGAWLEGGFPSQGNSYQRLAAQGGYSTELGAGHDTVGLEVMAGSGYAWGNPPESSRFFGGSSATDFLYEPLNSARVKAFPLGPMLRSFGEQQAGLRGANGLVSGGNFYWNLNLKLALPISGWSQPLIPAITIDENGKTLSSKLKSQVKGASNTLIEQFIGQGYSEDEAIAKTGAIFDDDITPTINYLADRANIYSIKPILLFDVAQISGSDGGSKIWAGVGGGVQMNVVNARLETGYMQTISPATDSSNGNFFLRFLFQDFF
jgi:hypothetical protein